MPEKPSTYESFSKTLDWEKRRKRRHDLIFAGFLTGWLTSLAINTISYLAVWAVLNSNIDLRSIGGLLAATMIIFVGVMFFLTYFFGYKDLRAVIRHPVFLWSSGVGLLIGLVAWTVILTVIMMQTAPV